MANLNQLLESIASLFQNTGVPEPVVHWVHPLMMVIVVFVMGSFLGLAGWRRRVVTDAAIQSRADHRKLAPWMFFFIAAGYTGGVLSLVIQHQAILESPYFWTGSTVLVLLVVNTVIAFANFGGNQAVLRTVHSYLGSTVLCLVFFHAVLGLKLGLAI